MSNPEREPEPAALITIGVGDKLWDYIEQMMQVGCFGETPEEITERALCKRIEETVISGLIDDREPLK